MNVLQWHRIHTPSLFWSVTHHNLPVLFESCILYLHRCTCFAQTPQIKRNTGSCCNARKTVRVQAVPVLDKNKAQICYSERTMRTGICVRLPTPRSNCTRVTDRYHVIIFRKLIPRRNLVINYNPKHNVWFKIQVKINTVMQNLFGLVHCIEQQRSVVIAVSSNWTNYFITIKKSNDGEICTAGRIRRQRRCKARWM